MGGEGFQRVLVGIFRVQAFAGVEVEAPAFDGHVLGIGTDQVHLDARFGLVEEGAMNEARRVDVAVQLVADALQQVEVERSGDMGAVVVGRLQHCTILDQIDADHQAAADR